MSDADAHHPARRPRRGRQEHDRVRGRRRRSSSSTPGSRSRATSTSASISSCPTSRTSRDRRDDDPRRRAHARPRGSRRRRCRTCCARCGAPEVWATRLTLGLVKSKLDEHGLLRSAELREIDPDGPPVELGPFRLEFVRMAHSIPDAVAVVLETPGGRIVVTRRLQDRPHARRRPPDRRRPARRARQPRRRPPARRLDERRAARAYTPSERVVGEAFRQIIPLRTGPRPRLLVRLERPPDAAGDRRRRRGRPQGLRRRPLDAQEPQHRAQPRLHRRARGRR